MAGSQQELGQQTSRLGSEVGATARSLGKDASSSIEAAGDVYTKYEDHKEISHGAATAADLLVDLEDKWNQQLKNSDPNDPSVAKKFYETQVKPSLENFKSAFTTENSQKYAEGVAERYNQHFAVKTAADMATMAGIAAKQNTQRTINGLSSATYNDPSSLSTALETLDHSVGSLVNSSPTMDAATAAKVKGDLTFEGKAAVIKSAVSGMIAKNPNVDLDAIQKKYGEYITGGELKQFQAAALRQAKTDAAAARADTLQKKQLADQQVHANSTKVISENVSIDPQTGRPVIGAKFFQDTMDLVRQNPDAPSTATTARTLLDWGESQLSKEAKVVTDQGVRQQLTDRMFDPDHPTTRLDLMKAQTAGKLSDHDFSTMNRLVTELEQSPLKGPVWQSTVAAAKDALIVNVPGLPGKDNIGVANYATFMQSFVPQYIAKSRAGTLEPNALDVKDPNSMISKAMAPFKRTQAQRMSDFVQGAGGIGSPSEPVKPAAAPEMPRITTKAEYDKLSNGTVYISAKDGQRYEKR